ncbi:MAG: TonB-dependent receptor [Flavobacteriales bacterium]|nr:TonB-dependent receptor [Flavobacteriales bacterium]
MRLFLTALFIITQTALSAQSESTVIGKVLDAENNATLPGASVFMQETKKGVATNSDGQFVLNTKPGKQELKATFVGYRECSKDVNLAPGDTLFIDIKLERITLKRVEITANRSDLTNSTKMGVNKLDMETVEVLPAFLGEVDLLKTIQLLPGIQSAGEGSSGFFVRGGGPDQNLILLDDAVVYNASHLLGFFSVFNSDIIEDVEIYKGGMPAQYGERLSSVIDISQREGSKEEFKGKGGVGLISSRLTLEGPIKKNESSFIISGRRTYIDVLTKPFLDENSEFGGSEYYFYDLNAKLDWELNDGGKLFLSGYLGNDAFDFASPQSEFSTRVGWGNKILTGGYQKAYDRALFKVTGSFTNYGFNFLGRQSDFELEVNSSITDYRLKPEFYFYLGNHRIKAGAAYTFHDISPNNSRAEQGETIFNLGDQQQFYSHEGGLFLSDEFNITTNLKVEAGIRYSGFIHTGPFKRYIVDQNGTKQDTIQYKRGANIANYQGFEPRILTRYRLNERESIKAAFTQNYQYIHLANLSPLALPTDVWLPTTEIVQPQRGRQYSIGYYRTFKEGMFETSIETYYKDMENLVEYKENTQPSDGVDNNEDNLLTFGRGVSYGVELFLKKTSGKTTGWIGYTLSRTEREFSELNNGLSYPAPFDRRHDLSVVATHRLSDKWTLSSTFIYATGRPITLPQSGYFIENSLVYNFEERNSFRMKDYHRLDISATYSVNPIKEIKDPTTGEIISREKRIQTKWVFSIYNVYNRLNPYFYYFENEGQVSNNTFNVQAKQVSLFPILPSVTWNFSF